MDAYDELRAQSGVDLTLESRVPAGAAACSEVPAPARLGDHPDRAHTCLHRAVRL